jgi:peroxiredoxin
MNIHCHPSEYEQYADVGRWRAIPITVPTAVFQTRVFDNSIEGPNPYRWEQKTTFDYFAGKRVVVFSLPGAFTPTCSTMQLPGFEDLHPQFVEKGIEEIYCVSVNDAFVMNAWAKAQEIIRIKMIPDGSLKFTEGMSMDVCKDNLGFGRRSWRYAMVVENGLITDFFVEKGREDDCAEDPYEYTNPSYILSNI